MPMLRLKKAPRGGSPKNNNRETPPAKNKWGITWGRKATTSKARPTRHLERTTIQEIANPRMMLIVGTEKNRIALLRRPVMKVPQGTARKLSRVRVWKAAALGTCI